jgi:hypothetical protein
VEGFERSNREQGIVARLRLGELIVDIVWGVAEADSFGGDADRLSGLSQGRFTQLQDG